VLQRDRRQFGPALLFGQRVRDIRQELVRAHPLVLDYRSELGVSWEGLASTLERLGRWEEASAAYQEAIREQRRAVDQGPGIFYFRSRLSGHYGWLAAGQRKQGQLGDAVATLLEQRKLWPTNPTELYRVASALALCFPKREAGEGTLTPLEQQHAALAMEVLRQALAQGYQDVAQIEKDRNLDSLRSREDFRTLLAGLKAPAKEKPESRPSTPSSDEP
jgi:tetratricopeptide (TPR) repeat protein